MSAHRAFHREPAPYWIRELFVFVAEPDVPADNNPAERSLRHLVVSRKVSGGTRSGQGTESKMTLASIFGTWRVQGLNPLATCRQLLTSPQARIHRWTRMDDVRTVEGG